MYLSRRFTVILVRNRQAIFQRNKITGLFLCVSSEPGEVLHGLCLIQNRVFHLFRFSGQKKVSEEEEMNF